MTDVLLAVTALEADGHLQALLVGQFVGFHERAEAGGIDAAGLFHEDVLAGRDGRGVVHRPEAGRGGQQHNIRPGGDRLLVGVKTREHAIRGNVDLFGDVGLLPQVRQAVAGIVGEGVGHGDQFDVLVGGQTVPGGAGAAAAATD